MSSNGGMEMYELVPEHLVSQVFKLGLETRLIADNKYMIPIIIKGKIRREEYKILAETGERKGFSSFKKVVIELKGNVDIEFLKYSGEVTITPIQKEPGYYTMRVHKFYKVNERQFKRVPYRRPIVINTAFQQEGILINISGAGAKFQCRSKIETETFGLEFVLLKKNISLTARLIEQKYDEEKEIYIIRCSFENIDKKDQQIIVRAVKEITLLAKKRLQEK